MAKWLEFLTWPRLPSSLSTLPEEMLATGYGAFRDRFLGVPLPS